MIIKFLKKCKICQSEWKHCENHQNHKLKDGFTLSSLILPIFSDKNIILDRKPYFLLKKIRENSLIM